MNFFENLKKQQRQLLIKDEPTCPKCQGTFTKDLSQIGGPSSCMSCGFIKNEQEFHTDATQFGIKTYGSTSGGAHTRQTVSMKYTDDERTKYKRELKIKAWISKLTELIPGAGERETLFKRSLKYIDTQEKSEPYNLVIASIIYLMKKEGRIMVDLKRVF